MQRLKDWIFRPLVSAFFGQLVFPVAGAFLVTTLTGVFSGLEAPWNYTLAASLGFFTLGVLAWVERRLRSGMPPPWGALGLGASVGTTATLSLAVSRGPGSSGLPLIDWELTGKHDHLLTVARKVRVLRFIAPVEKIVRADELPKRVRWRFRRILLVKDFGEQSVLVDEYARGFRVRAEVYHEDD
jgi:hypothetical protein